MTPKCPDCKRDQDDCICASPASAQEGWKLVGLEDLINTVLDADAALSRGDKNEALISVRVAASFVSLIKSHVANRKTLTAPTPPVSEDQKDAERFREGWTHACNALCMEIALWLERCPHCGMPAPKAPTMQEDKP